MIKNYASTKDINEITKIKHEQDLETTREAEITFTDKVMQVDPYFEDEDNLQPGSIFTDNMIKLEPDDETERDQYCTKGFISQTQQVIENMDRTKRRKKNTEHPGYCEDNEETGCGSQDYLPFSRHKYLQMQKKLRSVKNFELGRNDELSDMLHHHDRSIKVNQLENLECLISVPDISNNSIKSEIMEENTFEDSSNLQVKTTDFGEALNDYTTMLQNENCLFSIYENNPEFQSLLASYKLNNKVQLQKHKKTVGEKSRKCEICGVFIAGSANLIRHRRIHTGEKPYKCNVCDMRFTQSSNLQSHKKTHTGEKPYKCDICGVAIADSKNLVRHRRIHTGEKPYKCEVCDMRFSQSSNLQSHKKTHTGEKPYKCDICNVFFPSTKNLNRHIRVHTGEKPYKCDLCGVGFVEGSGLKKHERVHTGEKPYKCDVCGVCFAQCGNLNTHKRTHTGERPYTCSFCGIAFAEVSNLNRHRRTHTGEKPFKCDVCEVGFAEGSTLKTHKRTHSGEKPYTCDVCGVDFTQNGHLQSHKRIHTGKNRTNVTFVVFHSLMIETLTDIREYIRERNHTNVIHVT